MAILDDIDTNCDAASVYQFISIRFLVLGVIAPSRANQDARGCRTAKLNTRSLLLFLVTKPLLPPPQRPLNVVRPAAAQDFQQACDLFCHTRVPWYCHLATMRPPEKKIDGPTRNR